MGLPRTPSPRERDKNQPRGTAPLDGAAAMTTEQMMQSIMEQLAELKTQNAELKTAVETQANARLRLKVKA